MTNTTTADPAGEKPILKVKNFIDASQLKADLAFSDHDLSSAMMQQASKFSYYGVLAAEASRQVDVIKMLLENTEAAVYEHLRKDAAIKSEKVTEAMLEKTIARHPRVISMKKALNEARRVEATGKIAVEAFRHRRDMLVQMGLISREEMKGELRINEKAIRENVQHLQKEHALERLQKVREQ